MKQAEPTAIALLFCCVVLVGVLTFALTKLNDCRASAEYRIYTAMAQRAVQAEQALGRCFDRVEWEKGLKEEVAVLGQQLDECRGK